MTDTDLDALLNELPTTAPVPPALDAAVLAGIEQPPSRRTPTWAFAAAALVLLAVGVLALPPGEPTLVLADGVQYVDGRALVLAGDREVRVDGRARISVEPPGALLREGEQEATDAMLDKTHAIAALAGSFVTVAVYQGTATVSGPDTPEPITVQAGEQKQVGTPPPTPVRRVVRAAPAADDGGTAVRIAMDPDDDPDAVIAALEAQIAALQTQQSLAQGQLAAVQGDPQPWPDDIPDGYRPAAFERELRAAVDEEGAGEVLLVDCSEFPCLTVIRPGAYDGQGTSPELQAVIDRLTEQLGSAAIGVHNSRTGDGETDLLLSGLSFTPKEQHNDDVSVRNGFRMEGHLEGLTEDLMGQSEDEDVDVQ